MSPFNVFNGFKNFDLCVQDLKCGNSFILQTLFLCHLTLDVTMSTMNVFILLQEIVAIVFSSLIADKQISYLEVLYNPSVLESIEVSR